ncbi:hypothetical protein B4168_0096 [Anoxybacillus flavithermus]|nr:hypothetical protein B4168_0096 [Anoxybacillus flavithermus]
MFSFQGTFSPLCDFFMLTYHKHDVNNYFSCYERRIYFYHN